MSRVAIRMQMAVLRSFVRWASGLGRRGISTVIALALVSAAVKLTSICTEHKSIALKLYTG